MERNREGERERERKFEGDGEIIDDRNERKPNLKG